MPLFLAARSSAASGSLFAATVASFDFSNQAITSGTATPNALNPTGNAAITAASMLLESPAENIWAPSTVGLAARRHRPQPLLT